MKDTGAWVPKVGPDKLHSRAVELIKKNFEEERKLEAEVEKMLDTLEKDHGGTFQRHKMFPMLKKKLAQQKGFVL